MFNRVYKIRSHPNGSVVCVMCVTQILVNRHQVTSSASPVAILSNLLRLNKLLGVMLKDNAVTSLLSSMKKNLLWLSCCLINRKKKILFVYHFLCAPDCVSVNRFISAFWPNTVKPFFFYFFLFFIQPLNRNIS